MSTCSTVPVRREPSPRPGSGRSPDPCRATLAIPGLPADMRRHVPASPAGRTRESAALLITAVIRTCLGGCHVVVTACHGRSSAGGTRNGHTAAGPSLSPGRPGRRRARPRPGFEPPSTELRPDDDGHRWSCGRGDLGGLRDSAPPFPASPPAGLGNARHPPKARNRAVRSDGCPGATEPSLGSLGGAIKVPSPSGRSCEMT